MKLAKKHRYIIQAVGTGAFILLYSFTKADFRWIVALMASLAVILGTVFTQYPNIDTKNVVYSMLLPLHLVVGALLSLTFYPNLALPIKVLSCVAFIVVLYTVSLVNNIFLVVEDKQDSIPLYRVASAWGQVLLVVIAIPLFAGIFKLPINAIFQSVLIFAGSFIFCVYMLWSMQFDKVSKQLTVGDRVVFSLFISLLISSCAIAIAFLPGESFLRALFVSSVLMFGINYVRSYLKNMIRRNVILEYLAISLVFLFFFLIFNS